VSGTIEEWGEKSKPPKKSSGLPTKPKKNTLEQKLTPKKSQAKFRILKSFQKGLNDITRKKTFEIECLCLFIHHTM